MASIKERQKELIESNFLDQLGVQSIEGLSSLPLTKRLLAEAALIFVENARANIQKPNYQGRVRISTGALLDGVTSSPIREDANSLSFDVGYKADSPAAKYFDFVNQGVKGIVDKRKAPNSPYSFKKEKGLTPAPVMVNAIQQWLKTNKRDIDAREQPNLRRSRGGVSGGTMRSALALQRKRKKLTELQQQKNIAYAIATNIRKKGLSRSGFFDKAMEDTFNEPFFDAVASVVGADVSIGIRKLNKINLK